MNKVTCDKCSKVFPVATIKFKTRTLDKDKDVTLTFFKCPKCGEEYPVAVTDPEVRELIRQGKRKDAKEREIMLRIRYLNYGLKR